MFINKNIELRLADQNDEILLGFYSQALLGFELDEDGKEVDINNPKELNRFSIGLLFFNINIYY